MNDETLTKVIKNAVYEAIEEAALRSSECVCQLQDIGVTPDIHKEHHKCFQQMLSDFRKIRTAILIFAATSVVSGVGGLVYWAFRTTLVTK